MDSIYQLGKLASWMSSDKTNFREDDSPPPLEPGGDADKQVAESLQQFSILLEYERLQEIIPSGMYVVPSFDSPLTWHGILFVRQGFYKGGAFKFLVQLPEDYPDTPPQLCFISEVYHPMVDPQSGRVDTSGVFPEWRPVRDYASFMLPFLHRAMLRRGYCVYMIHSSRALVPRSTCPATPGHRSIPRPGIFSWRTPRRLPRRPPSARSRASRTCIRTPRGARCSSPRALSRHTRRFWSLCERPTLRTPWRIERPCSLIGSAITTPTRGRKLE
mmetsp:Transcript_45373/g.145560  ORF Transcript_45373/g.145560 Transcript_45373/m.145560 type:complete len:273 (-) Transcript_45373:70-888(-)